MSTGVFITINGSIAFNVFNDFSGLTLTQFPRDTGQGAIFVVGGAAAALPAS